MVDESFTNQLNSWNEKTLLKEIKFNRGNFSNLYQYIYQ